MPNGLVVSLPRSKTNQTGDQAELAVVPRATRTSRCPVAAVDHWLEPYDVVWASAGDEHSVFPTTCTELVRITGGKVLDVGT